MQIDFHYYASYCAAILAGYSHEESIEISYSNQFTDCCTKMVLSRVGGPLSAATTQTQMELVDTNSDVWGLQDITRIWASFHFLPKDLYADVKNAGKRYKNKYRLICGPNSDLLVETVKSAKNMSLQAIGIAMHILSDTWAHAYFAGTPSLVINNTDYSFREIIDGEERPVNFGLLRSENIEKGNYVNTMYRGFESSIMNLGHGRAGKLPDLSFARYKYMPAWGNYMEITKDNPADYYKAFCQMVYALKYYRGENEDFIKDTYDVESVKAWDKEIKEILEKRQTDSSLDWKELGEKISGKTIKEFDTEDYQIEYMKASEEEKKNTKFEQFIIAALHQKSMVTKRIYDSGNNLAGKSVDYDKDGFKGIKDFVKLVSIFDEENKNNIKNWGKKK